jgi:hypothetical protein
MGKDTKKTSQHSFGNKVRKFIDLLDRPWDWFGFIGGDKNSNGAVQQDELHIDYSTFWLEEAEEKQRKEIEQRMIEEEEIKNNYYRKLQEAEKAEKIRLENVEANNKKLKPFFSKLERYLDRINNINFDYQANSSYDLVENYKEVQRLASKNASKAEVVAEYLTDNAIENATYDITSEEKDMFSVNNYFTTLFNSPQFAQLPHMLWYMLTNNNKEPINQLDLMYQKFDEEQLEKLRSLVTFRYFSGIIDKEYEKTVRKYFYTKNSKYLETIKRYDREKIVIVSLDHEMVRLYFLNGSCLTFYSQTDGFFGDPSLNKTKGNRPVLSFQELEIPLEKIGNLNSDKVVRAIGDWICNKNTNHSFNSWKLLLKKEIKDLNSRKDFNKQLKNALHFELPTSQN